MEGFRDRLPVFCAPIILYLATGTRSLISNGALFASAIGLLFVDRQGMGRGGI